MAVPARAEQSRERAQELALPVALDAREPDDLAWPDVEVDIVESRPGEPATLSSGSAPAASSALAGKAWSTARPMIRRRISASETLAAATVPRVSPSRST